MPIRLAVPDLISNSYFPAVAAVQMGLFKEQGLDATIELLFPVPQTYADLRDGKLDFVAGSSHSVLYAFKDWEGAKLLCALADHMYWFLILRSDLQAQRGDLEKIRGLRIGAAPGPVDGLKQMLREVGIDPEKDVQIGPVPSTAGGGAVSFGVSAAEALRDGIIDGFWANGMGAEVAVRNGWGTLVLDIRRGDGPQVARGFTFGALVATDKKIQEEPEVVEAAIRATVKAQQLLKEDPERATAVGKALFPATESSLIAELVRRDLPFYNPDITREDVQMMNDFAAKIGLLSQDVPYERVVATQFAGLWQT
jgi:ABC-type nitrate/sulfonate/bicarbonate transport system substrate-binding protein